MAPPGRFSRERLFDHVGGSPGLPEDALREDRTPEPTPAAVPTPAAPPPIAREAAGSMPNATLLRVGMVGAAAALLLWGTWVSKGIYELRHHSNQIVKVRLSEIVADYVQSAARSGAPTDQAAQQTGTFLKVLNDTLEAHRTQGQIVMLANTIVAGDVPDITEQVRTEAYAKIARPQAGASGDVQNQMKQFMDANSAGAASTTEARHGQ
jgi:hypothetical protein